MVCRSTVRLSFSSSEGGDAIVTGSETQRQRESSQHWNEGLLTELGFRRLANTTIFRHASGVAVLSPGVGKGWFDLRQVNFDKLGDSLAAVVLRFVPDGFAVLPLNELRSHLNVQTVRPTKTGGPTYGFRCRVEDGGAAIRLVASSDHTDSFSTVMLGREDAVKAISSLLNSRPI